MTPTKKHQCSEMYVHNDSRWPDFHQCTRAGSLFEEDKWWCKTHAPSTQAAKNKAIGDKITLDMARAEYAAALHTLERRALALVVGIMTRDTTFWTDEQETEMAAIAAAAAAIADTGEAKEKP